ncbi:hypothetical protein GGX14DRAFT_632830 [Mycena pura]|uniref:Alcohol oxidase n=1 Tax=Mycena pura TaxID=153505 RepID=A0AAD6YEG0_9AGAR|nr:hypothetical protein GGX14DRAFT_632830 [Mycena pura]
MAPTTFDYVLIGGGTAGLTVAARLVEDPAIRVCVLEAGEDVTKELNFVVPGFVNNNLGQPRVDWGFMSTPQVHANGRRIYLPRGKALGGSSMHLSPWDRQRGISKAYWNIFGRDQSKLTRIHQSETFAPTAEEMFILQIDFNENAHGTSGPIQRTAPKWIADLHTPFNQGLSALGISCNRDAASGNNVGAWTSSLAIDSNRARRSSASAYYEPNKSNPKLVVITGAQATRILLPPTIREIWLPLESIFTRMASCTRCPLERKFCCVQASATAQHLRAALLSSISYPGTFKTPQLLELSGIVSYQPLFDVSATKRSLMPTRYSNYCTISINSILWNRDTLSNNLQEHFHVPFVTETDPIRYESLEALLSPTRAAEEWKVYEELKRGKLSTSGSSFFSFLTKGNCMNVDYVVPEKIRTSLNPAVENIQKAWLAGNNVPFLEIALYPGFLPTIGSTPEDGKSYFSVFTALTHPFSSGTVHIVSSNPLSALDIDYNVLDNQIDIDVLTHGIKFARRLVATEGLNEIIVKEVVPGPTVQSDDELENFIRDTIGVAFHPIGTASMLPQSEGGVVDSSLKVYGTSNLRVIDASIIPIHLSAHIQATVYAIAEKAADIIKRERK